MKEGSGGTLPKRASPPWGLPTTYPHDSALDPIPHHVCQPIGRAACDTGLGVSTTDPPPPKTAANSHGSPAAEPHQRHHGSPSTTGGNPSLHSFPIDPFSSGQASRAIQPPFDTSGGRESLKCPGENRCHRQFLHLVHRRRCVPRGSGGWDYGVRDTGRSAPRTAAVNLNQSNGQPTKRR